MFDAYHPIVMMVLRVALVGGGSACVKAHMGAQECSI